MQIDIYGEIKRAIKDGLTEWWKENKLEVEGIHAKTDDGQNLLTVRQFCEKYSFITQPGLRNKLNFRDWNGLAKCISKPGKRVLIKEKEAIEWFKNPPPEHDWTYDRKRYGPHD